MSVITIALTGTEVRTNFSGGNAWLRNDSTDTVYAGKSAGITAGADGVVAVPAGQSAPVYGANGTVYLLGTGSVQLIGSDYSTNPFKTSAQSGGSGADEVARAAITAHAGNADVHVTAAQKSAWDAKLPYIGVVEDLFDVKKTCVCAWNSSTLNTPYKAGLTNAGGGLCVINNAAGSAYTSYLVMISGGTDVFTASSNAGVIRGSWLKISDSNAATLGGKSASEFLQDIGGLVSGSLLEYALTLSASGFFVAGPGVTDTPNPGQTFFVEIRNYNGYLELIACETGTNTVSINNYNRTRWFGWHNVADGGNAASVGIYTAEKLAALEARVAALEGGT